jgi:hypothetical protein
VTPRVEALIVEMEEEPDAESADAFCHLARALERENAQLREALNLSETHRKRTPDCICPACKEIKARLEAK